MRTAAILLTLLLGSMPTQAQGQERLASLRVDRPLGYDHPAGIRRCVLFFPGLRLGDVAPGPQVKAVPIPGGVVVAVDRRGETSTPPGPSGPADKNQDFMAIAYSGDHRSRFLEVPLTSTGGRAGAAHLFIGRAALARMKGEAIRVLAVGEGPDVPANVAVTKFLERLEEAGKSGDQAFIEHALHLGKAARRALEKLDVAESSVHDFVGRLIKARQRQVSAGQSWGQWLIYRVADGGSFQLMRGRGASGIFRVASKDGEVVYLEFTLKRLPTGPVKIVDIRSLITGKSLSGSIRDAFLPTLKMRKGALQVPMVGLKGLAPERHLKRLGRLARRIGGDPYLKVLEGDIWLRKGKAARALKLYTRAAREDGELLQARAGRARALASLGRWAELARALKLLHARFGYDVNDLSDPVYAAFIKTPEYKALLRSLR